MVTDKPSNTADRIDPAAVPKRKLYTGAAMPAVGLGTFGSDHVGADEVAAAVLGAGRSGYRHFDCAPVYGNEKQIGGSLDRLRTEGVRREEMWVTSKLWNDKHAETDVIPACKQSLQDLHLEYLDLYLVHWPFPNHHPPGCDAESRSREAEPYIHEHFMTTWRQMERLVELGLVRHIGTSNVTIPKLKLILRDARIKPAVNEMEMHPHFQQRDLFNFVRGHNIVPVGYCPIGSPARPERDRTPEDTVDIEDPVIVDIAERHGIHPATLCVKWAEQNGQVPVPFSRTPRNYMANLRAVSEPPLSEEDMAAIQTIDRGNRLIKGQVFLWPGGRSWKDLWDETGRVTTSEEQPQNTGDHYE